MVRVSLVDSPVSSESDDMVKMIKVPDRMFADGEKPVGVRVLAYHRSSGIRSILRVLSDKEIQFIKNSTFGKFIDLADKPAFSGRFARYILSRQLKVNKKHQVWFRFAGNPIRFSLREFSIVTGLPCGKFPRKSRKNKKERMAETPYWPTLFGGTDVVTVSSVIRMLRKKTVVDKEIRIKYALLALAVPALTEVVQEVGSSSSESESDREDGDLHEKHNKRLTLCPEHARDVDHKCEVPVKCIIEDDSIHPVDNEYEDYSDEETDQKIENVLRLHSEKHDFNNSMFKGGLTMAEVERIGGKRKGKKNDTKTGKKSASPETVSDSKVATLLYDKMKPKISRFRETTKNLDATVKAATEEFVSMESRVGTLVESKIKSMIESVMVPMIERKLFQMKGDIIQSIETMITNQHQDPIINSKSQSSSGQDHYNSDPTSNDTENVQPTENTYVQDEPSHIPEGDINDSSTRCLSPHISGLTPSPNVTSLENQMEHRPPSKTVKFLAPVNDNSRFMKMALRDPFSFIENPLFALGLSQEEKQDHTDGRSSQEPESIEEDRHEKLPQRRKSLRLGNFLNSTLPQSTSVEQISGMELFPFIEIPSFSLGLSQEDNNDDLVNGLAAEQVAVEKDNPFDLQECRRGKRQKTVTHGLVDVFQCSPDILNRAWESQMAVYGKADSWEYTQKYTKLAQKNHIWCQVSNKDINDIVERAKPYSSKVMDVLMKHLSLSYANQSLSEESKKSVFLDSKFVASLSRNYSKFSKIQAKETHVFTKGLVEVFGEMVDHCSDHYVFYVPFNRDKKHWVAGWRISNSQLVPMVVERAKTVPQNIISADSSLSSVLLMQTHALSGIEACRCIAPHILASEGQRVAVLLYEYHMKL
uniref:Ubiquitin-like protease family profile domain-containing protein n=1 Tax=Brassica oleracea var. oleracea TaxID=109376 RepID=A0A0D2ZS02_BRAOL